VTPVSCFRSSFYIYTNQYVSDLIVSKMSFSTMPAILMFESTLVVRFHRCSRQSVISAIACRRAGRARILPADSRACLEYHSIRSLGQLNSSSLVILHFPHLAIRPFLRRKVQLPFFALAQYEPFGHSYSAMLCLCISIL